MFDRENAVAAAQHWIAGYIRAWESNNPTEIRALFTEHAEYRDGPAGEVWRGPDRIIAGWLGQKDEPGTWSFRHEVVAVDRDVAVIRGTTRYPGATQKQERYENLMVIRLTADGRADSFTDWWVVPDPSD